MISKSKIQLISSLSQKKFRDETGLFIAEGTKLVIELAKTFSCNSLFASHEWLIDNSILNVNEIVEVNEQELKKISNQKSPQGVLAIFVKPVDIWTIDEIMQKLSLVLDDVQDPGNLGTIIRIADWFGITDVFCSEYTADAYNPKTVQATMGALARVRIHTVNTVELLERCSGKLPIYGTFMDGENIYEADLTKNGIVVMGNEGNGISTKLEASINHRLLFPNFPTGQATSESLNVGVATALVCAEFRRRLKL